MTNPSQPVTISISESNAYRLRTVLNQLLKGTDMSLDGVNGRVVGGVVRIGIKSNV